MFRIWMIWQRRINLWKIMGENYEQYILKHDASYVHLCKAIRLFHSINQLCCIMDLKIFCIQLIFIIVTRICLDQEFEIWMPVWYPDVHYSSVDRRTFGSFADSEIVSLSLIATGIPAEANPCHLYIWRKLPSNRYKCTV